MTGGSLIVVTGAPGTGKSATIEALGAGVRRVVEPARPILAEERANGDTGTPDRDPTRFVDLLLRRSIENHESAAASDEITVFDRGVPDCIAYARILGCDPGPSVEAAATYRYRDEVLLFPPWEAIFANDDERTLSFADTVGFHDATVQAFRETGYALVEVPQGSVADRAAFVRNVIRRSS